LQILLGISTTIIKGDFSHLTHQTQLTILVLRLHSAMKTQTAMVTENQSCGLLVQTRLPNSLHLLLMISLIFYPSYRISNYLILKEEKQWLMKI